MSDSSTRFEQIELPETIEFGNAGQVAVTLSNTGETEFSDRLDGDRLISTDDNLGFDVNGVTSNFSDATPFVTPDMETVVADGLGGESEPVADLIADLIADLADREIADPLFGDGDFDDGGESVAIEGDGDFDDGLLAGGGGDDVLIGNDGDNTLQGGPGNDVLDGGGGNDTADFSDIPFEVTADLTTGTAQYVTAAGALVTDSLSNIENLTGSANNDFLTGDDGGNLLGGDIGDDTLLGGGGGDVLEGGFGNDFLQGGGGNDTLDGGDGFDTVSFADIGAEVAVTLNDDGSGSAEYVVNDATVVDTFTSIEAIVGSDNNDDITFAAGAAGTAAAGDGDDTIIASGVAANVIDGGAGDDFIAGGGGADILDGGEGVDTNSFFNIQAPVVADLSTGSAAYQTAAGVTISENALNFENLDGSEFNDQLLGDDSDNVLSGNGGDDLLAGRGGNDILEGGFGDDTLEGGIGDDVLNGGDGIDTVRFDDIDVGVTADLTAGLAERDTGFDLTIADLTLVNPNEGIAADQIVSEGIAGNLYFNFHTNDFPSGELRGQLNLVADNRDANGVGTVEFTASLSGDQEVPAPVDTDASGTATTLLTVVGDGSVTYSTEVSLVGLNQADLLPVDIGNGTLSPIHLHNAAVGVNGPVVVDVATDAGPEGIAAISETDSLIGIENVAGSNDADIIIGDANNNVLKGLDGDDILEGGGGDDILQGGFGDDLLQGGGGNDTLDGGDGFDTVSFADISAEVAVTLNQDGSGSAEYVVNGVTVVDTFTNIEAVVGSENNDNITLTPGITGAIAAGGDDDFLMELGGDDTLAGGLGEDSLPVDGDTIFDVDPFAPEGLAGIPGTIFDVFNQAIADPLVGNADGDVFDVGFGGSLLAGGGGDDVLIGNASDNTLQGGSGDDILGGGFGDDLLQGGGGNDSLDGGAGFDTISFADIGAAVTVTLNDDGSGLAEYVVNGVTVVDTFTNIEAIVGSENNDIITLASEISDTIATAGGDDSLVGLGGDGALGAGFGEDSLPGGDGAPLSDSENTLIENDQLLVQLDIALADAAFTDQDSQFQPNPEAVIAGGFAAFDETETSLADPGRPPLLGPSALPDDLSGNSIFAGGFADVLSNVDGGDFQFTAVSQALPGVTRPFDGFLDTINEDAISRLGSIGRATSLVDALPTDFNVGTPVADIIAQPSPLESQRDFVA